MEFAHDNVYRKQIPAITMTVVEHQQHDNHEEEQVFCSNGLDCVKVEVADCESMNPYSAFEVFQSKTMYSSGSGSCQLYREFRWII
jgi:hypothetical protein